MSETLRLKRRDDGSVKAARDLRRIGPLALGPDAICTLVAVEGDLGRRSGTRRSVRAAHPPHYLAALIDGIAATGVGVGLFDPQDRYVFGSPAFVEFLDVQPGPQTYASMMRHCHGSGRGIAIPNPDVDAWIRAALLKRRAQPLRTLEKDLCDGRWLRISETTFNNGWVLNILCDITDLKSHEITLCEARDAALVAAETDALTGLFNRAAIMSRFAEAVEHKGRSSEPLSIALIDLDHFKLINDGFGHDAGDRVLVDFGNLCRATLRTSDTFGRVGGEEFFCIMPATVVSDAADFMQRLRHRTERSRPTADRTLSYTMSAGVAVLEMGETAQAFYLRTDRLLYAAKTAGRNQVIA